MRIKHAAIPNQLERQLALTFTFRQRGAAKFILQIALLKKQMLLLKNFQNTPLFQLVI